jgi:hypothetical protein
VKALWPFSYRDKLMLCFIGIKILHPAVMLKVVKHLIADMLQYAKFAGRCLAMLRINKERKESGTNRPLNLHNRLTFPQSLYYASNELN